MTVPPFDPEKDRRNQQKHQIRLARFAEFREPLAIYSPRHGEDRWCVVGRLDDRLYTAIVTRRPEGLRVISLRRSNRREEQDYARGYHTSHD